MVRQTMAWIAIASLSLVAVGGDEEFSPEEMLAGMEQACADAAEAIAARQAETSLFDRLGGREGIRRILAEGTKLHMENPVIRHLFVDVEVEPMLDHGVDFLAIATGGQAEYTGRDVPELHAPMSITLEMFLAQGEDLGRAMKALGHGEDEQLEMMCGFIAARPLVMAVDGMVEE